MAFRYRLPAFRLMKLLLITTVAVMPLMGYGRPAQVSEVTPVPQTLIQKRQQAQEAKTEEFEISIHKAAWKGDIKAIEQHLAAGKDVDAKDDLYGDTPLLWAAGLGHKGVVEMLITKGADVNAKDVDDETPLNWAEEGKHKEITDLLRKQGGKTSEELKAAGI